MISRLAGAFLFGFMMYAAGPGGPVPGWTVDSRSATIRAVTGIPGALRLADPLVLPSGILAAEFASSGDLAVALTTDTPAHLLVITALRSTPAVIDLGELAEKSRILALNRKGTGAVLYSPSAQAVRFVTRLDGTPSLSEPVSTAALAGPVTAGLLESDGLCAILATSSVETLCVDAASRRILPEEGLSVAALAFSGNEQDLWIADIGGKRILRIESYSRQSFAVPFATEADGLSAPIALAIGSSGQVLAADAGAQAVFVIDPAGPSLQTVSLDIAPSQLRPLTDRSLLLLNDLGSLPFTLFALEGMRTYFVPAN